MAYGEGCCAAGLLDNSEEELGRQLNTPPHCLEGERERERVSELSHIYIVYHNVNSFIIIIVLSSALTCLSPPPPPLIVLILLSQVLILSSDETLCNSMRSSVDGP